MLSSIPPILIPNQDSEGIIYYNNLGSRNVDTFALKEIIVNKGCGEAYKAAEGWTTYADLIVEAS
jgi:hypothetical protein